MLFVTCDVMKVSVILPLYNGAATLPGCLDGLQAQSLHDWECIAVNDASPDNSPDILESYARRDSRIKLIHHNNNCGVAAARNTALAHARGEYVHFLDQDDHLFPDGVEQLLRSALRHPDVAGIHGDYCLVDTRSEKILSRVETAPALGFEDIASFRGLIPLCALMPRSAVLKVGGFQPGFEGCDDFDLFAKLTRSGKDFRHCPVLVGQWRFHGRNNSRNAMHMLENGLKVIDKLFAPDDRVPEPDRRWVNGAPPELRPTTSTRLFFYQFAIPVGLGDIQGAVELGLAFARLARADYLTPESFDFLHYPLQFEALLAGDAGRDYFLRFESILVSVLTQMEQQLPSPGLAVAALTILRNRYIESLVSENRETCPRKSTVTVTARSYRLGRSLVGLLDPIRSVIRLFK